MRIREAVADDVPAVSRLEEEMFGADAWSEASVAEELTGPRRRALVATAEDGRVLGYAVTLASGDVVDLQRVAVVPAFRRTGLASRLLAAFDVEPTRKGAASMMLEVSESNAAARAFYATRGFVEVDRRRRYYRDGSDALVLSRPLVGSPLTDEGRTA